MSRLPSWRLFLVAALLLALAAAALLVTAGSQQHVPPPFGPARNGALLFGNGDIYIRDSIDGPARLVIGGPTYDFAAGFTRDGTRLTFLRRVAGTEGSPDERLQMFAADTDGSNPVALTPPLVAPDWSDIAPDNGSMVFISGDPATRQSLFVANLLQPGEPRELPIGNPPMSASFPNYLPPTGDEIVFRGRTASDDPRGRSGIFAIRPDGTGLRPITPTDGNPDDGYQFPQPSPDGRYIAYTWWDRVLSGLRINILDLRTGEDRILTDVGRSEGYATFSPDSRRIVFVNYISDTNQDHGRADRRQLAAGAHGSELSPGQQQVHRRDVLARRQVGRRQRSGVRRNATRRRGERRQRDAPGVVGGRPLGLAAPRALTSRSAPPACRSTSSPGEQGVRSRPR